MNSLLMVGDKQAFDASLYEALKSSGFSVTADDDAGGDLDDFNPEETSAVIVHLGSSRGDSFLLMHRMRRALPQMPIIAVAPFRDVSVQRHAQRCGATVVLAEPVDPDDLAAFVVGYAGLNNSRVLV